MMWSIFELKKIFITIEISDEVKEGSIFIQIWKGYISQVRGHKVVEYITEDTIDKTFCCNATIAFAVVKFDIVEDSIQTSTTLSTLRLQLLMSHRLLCLKFYRKNFTLPI